MSRPCLFSLSRIHIGHCHLYPARLLSSKCTTHTVIPDSQKSMGYELGRESVSHCVAPPTIIVKSQPTPTTTVPAIRILCRVFSVSNLTCAKPVTYPVRTIRGLYHGAHARSTLNDLSGSQFSAIISLFGTLSVHHPPRQFMSPLVRHMGKGRSRVWWGFIFQMVRDKKRVTGILKEGDLYWLLRAKTAVASQTCLSVYAGDSGGLSIHVEEFY